jgi:hypothetical protein
MNRLLLPFLLLLFSASAKAQNEPLPIFCGNEALDHIIGNHYPELQKSFRLTFDHVKAQQKSPESETLNIRVVVHVVWNDPEENLPDSVIWSQIDVLNEDYNRLNPDTANLRPIFDIAAGNPLIQFELADIVRIETDQTFTLNLLGNEILSNLKSTAAGGSDAWDTDAYLNIWICKIQPIAIGGITLGQILGFAFPPNDLGNWPANSGAPSPDQDGVVLDYRVVGRNNPNTVQVPGGAGNLAVQGRTGTHEVGHYLGLRHIWGDGGILGLPNNCNQSDGIDDTPFANAQSPFNCDITRNTCNTVELFYGIDMPDLIENYMDYSSEDCMNMFTQGQAAHMRSVLEGPRSGLVQPPSSLQSAADLRPMRLFPNPAIGNARLEFSLEQPQRLTCQLFSADGRLHWQSSTADFASGNHVIQIPAEHLPAGMYYIRIGANAVPLVKQ